MDFVLDNLITQRTAMCACAHTEWRDWGALRTSEAVQAVAVEPEVQQDTNVGIAVYVVALFGNKPPERRYPKKRPIP